MTEPDEAVIMVFTRLGKLVRISAMDPAILTEVVVQGPATAGEAALRHLVLAKLERALRQQRGRRPSGCR
jgi:hypothetical protein